MRRLRVVAIGGGTGLYTLLKGMREYDLDLTAIVAMTDDGGSTGELRDEFGILPPGDVRRCIVALSESPEMMKELFQYRFIKGAVAGHSFGNLFITALRELTGSDEQAISEAARLLRVKGKVYPVTLENRRLQAELENGEIIIGETNIDIPKHDPNLKIKRLFLNSPAKINPKALKAINRADMIILGPGDLYGSVIANLLVSGMSRAIRHSRATIVYICNLMTKYGETNNYTVEDFMRSLEKYLGKGVLDYVIVGNLRLDKKTKAIYAREHADPVRFTLANPKEFSCRFVQARIAAKGNLLRHDSQKLAKIIWSLLQIDNKLTFVEF
ncbi:YvcK family protein [Candidatus Berkelbacteria bacterium]|nr:YvcK family protein [Candidatus Berkelbacteria bacterium]